MFGPFQLLPEDAREAFLRSQTTEDADTFIGTYLVRRLLLVGSLAMLPALALSLSRALYTGWSPVFTVHCLCMAAVWIVVLLRERLPNAVVVSTGPAAVFALTLAETYFFGFTTGGPILAMTVPLFSLPIFGFRRAVRIFAMEIAIFAILYVFFLPGHYGHSFDPGVIKLAKAPVTYYLSFLTGAIFCGLLLYSFGVLMEALHERQRAFESQSETMARDKERFDLAMEGSNDGLWDWDIETGVVYRSDRWYQQLGYRPAKLPDSVTSPESQDFFVNLVHPRDLDRILTVDAEKLAKSGSKKVETEFRMRHADGSWVPILSRAIVVTRDGKPVRVVGTHIDLSERERLVADLKRVESMLTEGMEALPLGLAFFGRSGKLSVANAKFAELMELPERSVQPDTRFVDIVRAHADWAKSQCGFSSAELFIQARLRATDGGPPWEYQLPTGRTIEIFECATSRGGFMSVVADVTEARRRQAELYQAQKMDAVGKLTGGIAHDFNNLLAVIQGNADVLGYSVPEGRAEIDAIRSAAQRGAELTQRLLAFSRQQPLRPRAVSPRELIGGMLPILERSLGEAFGIAFDVPQNVWNILVDSGQLENAILNLVINGRDAMARGGLIEVAARNATLEDGLPEIAVAPGDYVVISVADNGTGMTGDTLRQAFDPFFTTKDVGRGSGLGLAMVHGFARQSGGGVTIDTEVGKGTRVSIYLRRARARVAQKETGRPRAAPAMGQGESILVIEDDPSVRAMTCQMLETLGYRVTSAEDAQAGEETLLGGQAFDLVLSDIVLPGGKFGHEMIRDVREKRNDFRVIFMSGYSPDASDELRVLLETHLLLNKPFSLQKLAEAVRNTLATPLPGALGDGIAATTAGEAPVQAE